MAADVWAVCAIGLQNPPVSPSLLFAPWVMIMMGSNNIQQHAWPHSLSTASCTWVENIQLAKKKGGILPDHLDKTNLVTTLDQLVIYAGSRPLDSCPVINKKLG